jgi:hypothetical protein
MSATACRGRNDPTIRRLERGHRTDCRSLTHTTDTQPTQPLHAPIPLSPSQVDSAPTLSSHAASPLSFTSLSCHRWPASMCHIALATTRVPNRVGTRPARAHTQRQAQPKNPKLASGVENEFCSLTDLQSVVALMIEQSGRF